jgi:drug/metabolite transporter (DMT)-like permease
MSLSEPSESSPHQQLLTAPAPNHTGTHRAPQTSKVVPYLILAFAATVWSSSFILMKRGLMVFSPLQVASLRIVIACIATLPVAVFAVKQVNKQYWKPLTLVGLLGSGIPAVLFCVAQSHINSSTAGLLNSCTPVFTLLVGVTMFHLRPTRFQIGGVLCGLAGAVTLILAASKETSSGNPLYGLLIVAATICYGFSSNILGRYLGAVKPLYTNSLILLPIMPLYAVYLVASDFGALMGTHPGAWQAFTAIAALAVVGTAITNVFFTHLVALSGPLFASSVTYLIPIGALAWGLADGESLSGLHLAGITAILVGVYLVNSKSTKKVSTTSVNDTLHRTTNSTRHLTNHAATPSTIETPRASSE